MAALPSVTYRVDVPLRTSHISHLKASWELRKVHTEQSQAPSSRDLLVRFLLQRSKKIQLNILEKT